jgi:hypothetical protein
MKDEGLELVMLVDVLGQMSSIPPASTTSERQANFKLMFDKVNGFIAAQAKTPQRCVLDPILR